MRQPVSPTEARRFHSVLLGRSMVEMFSSAPTPPDWTRLLAPRVVEAPDEFVRELTGITSRWERAGEKVRPWFRGVPLASFLLEPSLLRRRASPDLGERDLRAAEGNLKHHFKAMGTRFFESLPSSDLELLAIMQHHGVPTRLLDWTENALIALYFAVREGRFLNVQEDAVVWVLDPVSLTEARVKRRTILFSDPLILDPASEGHLPLPFYPAHGSSRLTTQRGAFTVHPFEPEHSLLEAALQRLDGSSGTFLRGLRIAGGKRGYIRDGLVEALGIGEFTIFPNLEGLARELTMREGLEP